MIKSLQAVDKVIVLAICTNWMPPKRYWQTPCGDSPHKNSPEDCFCSPSCAYMTIQYGLGRRPDRSHIGALTGSLARLLQRAAWMPAVAPPRPFKLFQKLDQNF